MINFYTATKTIKGKEYTAQFNGISAALKAVDDSYIEGSKNTSVYKLAKYLFENVIVDPKLDIDDFGAEMIGEEKTKQIGDVEYVARFNGLSKALKAIDGCYIEGTGNTSIEKLAAYILDNVVVKPAKLTIDDFQSMNEFNEVIEFAREVMQGGDIMNEFNEVVNFAQEVMQGNFRNGENRKSIKKASK